jgi:hypothetical protein
MRFFLYTVPRVSFGVNQEKNPCLPGTGTAVKRGSFLVFAVNYAGRNAFFMQDFTYFLQKRPAPKSRSYPNAADR